MWNVVNREASWAVSERPGTYGKSPAAGEPIVRRGKELAHELEANGYRDFVGEAA